MTTTAVIILSLLLAPAAGAYFVRDKPVGYVDNHLHGFRLHTNKVRAAKCLPLLRWSTAGHELPPKGTTRRTFIRVAAKRYHLRAMVAASSCGPPHMALWKCIHNREGDWQDGGWPYWGGLQMGAWFLERYMGITSPRGSIGPNGWINAPSMLAQMWAAERAYRGSGYSRAFLYGQWPNTAPPCGHLA